MDALSKNYRLATLDTLVPKPATKPGDIGLEKIPKIAGESISTYRIRPESFFIAIKNENRKGQLIWKSIHKINVEDVNEIVVHLKRFGHSVQINTGTHGDDNGGSALDDPKKADAKFLNQDIAANLRSNNVAIESVSSEKPLVYGRKANHVINAWCYSQSTPDSLSISPVRFLREYYINQCGELPLPMSNETYPLEKLFAELVIMPINKNDPKDHPMNRVQQRTSLDCLFDHDGPKPVRRVRLLGAAGVGKSTLCQKLAHDWASGHLFQDRFKAVYWIPLRILNRFVVQGNDLHQLPDSDRFLARVLAKIVLKQSDLEDSLLHRIKTDRKETLIILDGYDEANLELRQVLDPLFSDPDLHILLTSRPGVAQELEPHFQRTVENLGFSNEHIATYCNYFFSRKENNLVTEQSCKDFLANLERYDYLSRIAHVPLQLQMLCCLWEQGERQSDFPTDATHLYKRMVDQLLHWQCGKVGKDPFSITPDYKRSLLTVLGHIANQGIAEGKLMIPRNEIACLLENHKFSEKELLDTGLVKVTGSGLHTYYHFIHLTFQEYLVASWIRRESAEDLEDFILKNRYNSAYRLTLAFLAGAIFHADNSFNKIATNTFFATLTQDWTTDLTPPSAFALLLRCLNECTGYTGKIPSLDRFLEGDSSLLDMTIDIADFQYNFPCVLWLSFQGLIQALRWLVNQKGSDILQIIDSTGLTVMHATHGRLEMMEWLHQQDPSLIKFGGFTPMHLFACLGDVGAMQWLCQKDPNQLQRIAKFSEVNEGKYNVMKLAARQGQFEAIKWLYEQNPKLLQNANNFELACASSDGGWKVMKWLHEQDPTLINLHKLQIRQNDSPMRMAIELDNIEAMQWVHQLHPDLIQKNDNLGETLMHRAAYDGCLRAMDWLYDQDPDLIQKTDNSGRTPMHHAAKHGELVVMKWLYGKDPQLIRKTDASGQTPLHLAIHCADYEVDYVEVVEWFYDQDPQLIQIIYEHGRTPMHLAVMKNDLQTMKWLYCKLPDLIQKTDDDGRTPMHYAAMHGKLQAMKWLSDQDPDLIQKTDNNGKTPMHCINDDGKTIMHKAAEQDQLEVMKWLHEQDSSLIQMTNKDGKTVMHYAAEYGRLQAMQWLYCKLPDLIQKIDNKGSTPMHVAAKGNQLQAMQWLYEEDPSLIHKTDKDGGTAMHTAAGYSNFAVMMWLHVKDPQLIQRTDNNGRTPMQCGNRPPMRQAVREDNLLIMHWLYSLDSSLIQKIDDNGRTPMHIAAEYCALTAMKWLYGKDPQLIQRVDNCGQTPMHLAVDGETGRSAGKRRIDIMRWLYGKDPQLIQRTDNNGRAPLDYYPDIQYRSEVIDQIRGKGPPLLQEDQNFIQNHEVNIHEIKICTIL